MPPHTHAHAFGYHCKCRPHAQGTGPTIRTSHGQAHGNGHLQRDTQHALPSAHHADLNLGCILGVNEIGRRRDRPSAARIGQRLRQRHHAMHMGPRAGRIPQPGAHAPCVPCPLAPSGVRTCGPPMSGCSCTLKRASICVNALRTTTMPKACRQAHAHVTRMSHACTAPHRAVHNSSPTREHQMHALLVARTEGLHLRHAPCAMPTKMRQAHSSMLAAARTAPAHTCTWWASTQSNAYRQAGAAFSASPAGPPALESSRAAWRTSPDPHSS